MIIIYFKIPKIIIHFFLSERDDVLREAEILHKARFSYILPILGICIEPEFLGIVTEYMPNGSLNELLHRVSTVLFSYYHFSYSYRIVVSHLIRFFVGT